MDRIDCLRLKLTQQEMLKISGGKKTCYGYMGEYLEEIHCDPLTPGVRCYDKMTVYSVNLCRNNGQIIKKIGEETRHDGTVIIPN